MQVFIDTETEGKKDLINYQREFYNLMTYFSSNLGPEAIDSPQFLI